MATSAGSIAASIQVELLSPARVMTRVTAGRVNVPGINGNLGILPGHAGLVSELGIGEVTISGGDLTEEQSYFVAGGYVEVTGSKVTILVDVVEKKSEINVERAEKAKQRALKVLTQREGDVDYPRAQEALKRAELRIAFATTKH